MNIRQQPFFKQRLSKPHAPTRAMRPPNLRWRGTDDPSKLSASSSPQNGSPRHPKNRQDLENALVYLGSTLAAVALLAGATELCIALWLGSSLYGLGTSGFRLIKGLKQRP